MTLPIPHRREVPPREPVAALPAIERKADLVFEGGGVKGIALVGTALALADNGYSFARIAGSSAGAIVGAIIAAMEKSGEPLSRANDVMRTLDYTRMLDRRGASKAFRWWPTAANALGILFNKGMHPGGYLQDWTRGVLADLGVRNFGDLRFHDPGSAFTANKSYRLVVTASDLSRQRLMYLPWDLAAYGLHADKFSVARAVRASSAIPFMFEPVRLRSKFGTSTLLDGSILRSYPIEIFDRHDGKPSRWPTIGIRLSSPAGDRTPAKPVTGPVSLISSLIYTTVDSTQIRHVSDPLDVERSIFAKPRGVRWTDFDLTPRQRESLYEAGYAAGLKWIKKHPGGAPSPQPVTNTGQVDLV